MNDFESKQTRTGYLIKTAQHREWNSGVRRRVSGAALALAIIIVLGLVATKSAQAQDAEQPYGGVIRDAAGNFYGTGSASGKYGAGAVYKLDKSGHETVLYSFKGTGGDGALPEAGLILDAAGNLYGTTYEGGNGGCYNGDGCGTVFKLNKSGHETVLYRFKGTGGDGANPAAQPVLDGAGNLYGTTYHGGILTKSNCNASETGCGTVYKLDKSGKETVLYRFKGTGDGALPGAGLILDAAGNLYSATYFGGDFGGPCAYFGGCGTVYKVDKSGRETVLYRFKGTGKDGAFPNGVIQDAVGNLYGTTQQGGGVGAGTVFKLDKSGHETVLYAFTGTGDGSNPASSPVRDVKGDLYGTTLYGGDRPCDGGMGCGVVFKVSTKDEETVLHKFSGYSAGDGAFPWDLPALILDAAGSVYGTTNAGGAGAEGTVFKVDKSGTETILYSFQ